MAVPIPGGDELLVVRRQITPGSETDWTVETREYDANLNLIRVTDPEGHVTEYDYSPRNLLAATRSGLGAEALDEPIVETVSYNDDRQVVIRTDARGNPWSTSYDGYDRPKEVRDPLGNRSLTEYDNNGNATAERSCDDGGKLAERGAVYDLLNRRTEAREWLWEDSTGLACEPGTPGARMLVTRFAFAAASNLEEVEDALGRKTTLLYDAAERRVETLDPAGNRQLHDLDLSGNVVVSRAFEIDPDGVVTEVVATATYDALNRPVGRSDALNNHTSIHYDARGQVTLLVDPEGYLTSYSYDGLNRRTWERRPEGIAIDYTYDRDSLLTRYRDALGNSTIHSHDAVHRQRSVTYPDSQVETYGYDPAHNQTGRVDQRGTEIVQDFDLANRMTSRTVRPVEGDPVVGPLAESYVYDGLHRLIRAQSGSLVTELAYDSLSRTLSDRTAGRTVSYRYDDVSNPTKTTYPSAYEVHRTFDPLNRIEAATNAGGNPLVGYGYRGPYVVQSKTVGAGITGEMRFDAARRQTAGVYTAASGLPALEEEVFWSPRSLKTGLSRSDLNRSGFSLAYDGAGRLTEAAREPDPLAALENNGIPDPAALASAADTFRFHYDSAQNLIGREELTYGVPEATDLPVDVSGRNRPGAIGDRPLAWDADGNLIAKDGRLFHYDYRNRLTLVTDEVGGEIAQYTYDAFNRRVRVETGGKVRETVWDGWQAIEEYEDGGLTERQVYGGGLDEAVSIERDLDGDGTLEQTYLPLYDSSGNLAVVTDPAGKPIERSSFNPYGKVALRVDAIPPAVEQLRVVQDTIWLEMSEEVLASQLVEAAESGSLALYNVTADESLSIAVSQPVEAGDQAWRRQVITTTDLPAAGDDVRLTIEPTALVDLFHNRPAAVFTQTFSWPAGDAVVLDETPPAVAVVIVRDGVVEIEFTEEADPSAAASAIELDGAATTWTLAADRYTLVAGTVLEPGERSLTIGTQALDLAGKGLAEPFAATILVDGDVPEQIVYRRPDPRETPDSTVANRFAFHGLPKDPETGFVYFRNRYYDPEMGRFITADPMGYIDGPSMYQGFMNSPLNYMDPFGLTSRTDIDEGELFYTWHLGWLDTNHMQTQALKEPWRMLRDAKPGDRVVFTIALEQGQDLKGWKRFLGYKKSQATFQVDVRSSDPQLRKRQLLAAWQQISVQFEEHQGTGIQASQWANTMLGMLSREEDKIASSFSTEDLVSNLVAFYSTVEEVPWEKLVDTVGGRLGSSEKEFSFLLWDCTDARLKKDGNREWTPKYLRLAPPNKGCEAKRDRLTRLYWEYLKAYGAPTFPESMRLVPEHDGVTRINPVDE